MQTFLPYPDFAESARCLDYKRLGKQRVEALQLARSLIQPTGWSNHPASVMWRGHLGELIEYGLAICAEWRSRGYQDTVGMSLYELKVNIDLYPGKPWWIGDAAFHASHRSNLLRKDPAHYGQFGWHEPTTLSYLWPSTTPGEFMRSRE